MLPWLAQGKSLTAFRVASFILRVLGGRGQRGSLGVVIAAARVRIETVSDLAIVESIYKKIRWLH